MAIVKLKHPLSELRGILKRSDRYYARMLNGQCIIQRRPNRKAHIPSEAELCNRQNFARRWAGWNKKTPPPPSSPSSSPPPPQLPSPPCLCADHHGTYTAHQHINTSTQPHNNTSTFTNNMKSLYKSELAAQMGISKTTMGVYMRRIEHLLPHYSRHQTLLTPDQVRIVCDHYGIT